MSDMFKGWFDVDRKGLAKLIERRGKIWLLHELIANAWDADGVTTVEVTLFPEEGVPQATVAVTDDAPDGFADMSHAWTLFAESSRKSQAQKRGRFNLGEKLVLALCTEATIISTKAACIFDNRGRSTLKARRNAGTEFQGIAKITRAELAEIQKDLRKLISPIGITTRVNGEALPSRTPIKVIEATLATEIADGEDGILRRTARKCMLNVYEVALGETAMLYEMGIPVVETGDKWHVDVQQKVPLNMDRDNVTPAYLRDVRTLVVNALHDRLTEDDAATTFVNEALADEDATPEAVKRALDLKYGQKRAIFDPSDPEANMNLVSQGYTLIKGAQLTSAQWTNVKKHGAATPSGRIAPTQKALFGPGGKDVWVPIEKWTSEMHRIVEISKKMCAALIDQPVDVSILSDIKLGYAACFGGGPGVGPMRLSIPHLTFNLGRLGHEFFRSSVENGALWQLLIHEVGHWYEPNHLDEKYHEALCRLGSKMARLALSTPELFRS